MDDKVPSPLGCQQKNPFLNITSRLAKKSVTSTSIVFIVFFIIIFLGASICSMDLFVVKEGRSVQETAVANTKRDHKKIIKIPLNCSTGNITQTCPSTYPKKFKPTNLSPPVACPDYFRWIHRDLDAWRKTGITRETLERAKRYAHFRLVILGGKVYVKQYDKAFQTRDVFTIWGILQLLRLYPGQVPDLELLFMCHDRPMIWKRDYQGENATWPPPPLFHYCGHKDAFDIVFPDWSFWGWPEVNVRPWKRLMEAIREGNERVKWKDRIPYAFWKGNPGVSDIRRDLMKCNFSVSHKYDSNVRLYAQDWDKEVAQGYKNSNLEDQCTHRYKIYVEGVAWSVSEKYILACDSMTLLIKPEFYDFFIRGMSPMEHYWPIRRNNKCADLKFAVDWGNKYPHKAEAIGKKGSEFIRKNLEEKYVYDYMLHVLKEYAKLLKVKVEVPEGAKETCSETMACPIDDGGSSVVKKFMEDSMVMSSSGDEAPCVLSPPYDEKQLCRLLERNKGAEERVARWTDEYWKIHNTI